MKGAAIFLICAIVFVLGDEINDDPSQVAAICAVEDSDGVLVAHEHCNKFYKCSEGKPVALSCQPGFLYSPINKWCDWPYKVDCGNRIIPGEDSDSSEGGGGGDGGGGNEEINDDPSQAPAICSIEGSDGVLVAHEYCNKFYKCSEGVPVALECQPGLLYSPINKWCDWPRKVNCGDRLIPGEGNSNNNKPGSDDSGNNFGIADEPNYVVNDDPSQAPTICTAKDSNGILVAHEHCNKFYKCFEGAPVTLRCPAGLLYSPIKLWCDWPYNVNCGNRIIPDEDLDSPDGGGDVGDKPSEVVNDDPGQAPAICAAEGSNGILIAHEYCNRFYQCFDGVPVPLRCRPGFFYNPITTWCDSSENVNCGNRIILDDDSDNADSPGDGNGGNDEAGNPIDEVKDDPSQALTICAAKDSNGILVAHEYCNQFYKCFEGTPVARRCPAGLLYNPKREWCDWPYNVNCGSRIIPDEDLDSPDGGGDVGDKPSEVVNDDPSQAPAICAAEGSNGILIAHEYCNRFYQCFDGHPVPLRCRPGFFYNPITTWCDSPKNVNCGNRIILDDDSDNADSPGGGSGGNDEAGNPIDEVKDDPSQAPTICVAKDSDGILIAHEYCNQFYKCFEGIPVARRCPAGLLYNPKREWCDWPYNVNCGNRIIPDEDLDSPDGGGDVGDKPSEIVNDDPSQAPAICAAEGSNGILIAHEYCNRFYQCFDGHPVPLRCRPGFFYNPITTWCDSPKNVNCGNRKIIDDDKDNTNNPGGGGGGNDEAGKPVDEVNDDPSKAPAICAVPGSEGVMVAHEYCNQFYKCSGTVPVVLYCPGTLLYNPLREWCDWPRNVNCGDRIIPENS